jgi:hypothetical protein
MTDRKFDRIADDFLSSGPTVLPDRVLDAAFEEVHRTRQRRVLWRAPWRFPIMNTYAKLAMAGVAVLAVAFLGQNLLGSGGNGVGGQPTTSPSPSVTAAPAGSAAAELTTPPLTGQFTSGSHGFSIAYPEGWTIRPATEPWTTEYVDAFGQQGDLISGEEVYLSLASQPLAGRTPAEWEADVWQIDGVCPEVEPIHVDGSPGVYGCNLALVTSGGRGYWIKLNDTAPVENPEYDRAWFQSVLATMKLHPEDAIDAVASPSPS